MVFEEGLAIGKHSDEAGIDAVEGGYLGMGGVIGSLLGTNEGYKKCIEGGNMCLVASGKASGHVLASTECGAVGD